MSASAVEPAPVDARATSPSRRVIPLALGVAVTILTATGLSGLGDAPHPTASTEEISRYFIERRDDVLMAAPFGYLGAISLVLFSVQLSWHLRRIGRNSAAALVVVGGSLCGAYFAGLHLTLTTIAYEVADSSPDTAKALFVVTILAVPVLGVGVIAMLGGLAAGDRGAELVPRWLIWLSVAGAAAGMLSLVSFAEEGLFSPDVQQQIVGNLLLLWPLATGAALTWRSRSAGTP
jgi:hypothetical protein